MIVLGEMFSCPYATKYFREYGEVVPAVGAAISSDAGPSVKLLSELSKKLKVWIVGGSVPELDGDKVYNTAIVFNDQGTLVAKHRKVHLFDIDVKEDPAKGIKAIRFRESETLSPGQEITVFETPWCSVGLAICYDLRFSELALAMRQQGAKLLIYPGAFNMTTGPAHWELLARGRAVDTQSWVILCSPARSTDPKDYQAYGHSMLVSPWAAVKVETDHNVGISVGEVDPTEADRIRSQIPISFQKRTDLWNLQIEESSAKRLKTA